MKLSLCCSNVFLPLMRLLFLAFCWNRLTDCLVFALTNSRSVPVTCRVSDETEEDYRQHFDLSSLAAAGVWEVLDNDLLSGVKKFYLGVCHSLDMSGSLCPDREAAVCVTSIINGTQISDVPNAGKVTQELKMQGEGRVVLEYNNGQSCMHMGKDIGYRTVINFMCSEEDGSLANGPSYQGMVGNCEYSFLWSTAAACPVSGYDVVDDCTIQLHNSHHTMNLLPLHKDSFYTVTAGNRTFEMNICEEVKGGHCEKGVSICETDGRHTVKKNLGMKIGMELKYEGDLLKLFYYDVDNQGILQTSEILLECSDSAHHGTPTFEGDEENTHKFMLRTPLACVPKPVDCVVNNDFNIYDLTPLSLNTGNWEVTDTRAIHADLQYHINVCTPLNTVADYACPGGNVGACQTSISSNISFNLGYIQGKPVIEKDGSIVLRYYGGSVCRGGSYMRSTEIIFYCSQREQGPQFQGETQDCIYKFEWYTPAACSLQDSSSEDCTVTDKLYGYKYDFRPLHQTDKDYVVDGIDGVKFLVNVCGKSVHHCNGQNNTGVCQRRATGELDLGKSNSQVMSHDGSLSIQYTNGELCNRNDRSSSTIVFVCDHAVEKGTPEFLTEDENCSYFFLWKTKLACPEFREIECSVRDNKGNEYDLSTLSLPRANYRIFTSDGEVGFVINVCRSVVHGSDARCQQNSGACMIKYLETDINKKYVNLGDVHKGPFIQNGNLHLQYTLGDICTDQNTQQTHMKTVIDFKCDTTKWETEPEFLYHRHCEYVFLWETAAACPIEREVEETHTEVNEENCTATNPVTGFRFDMHAMKKEKGYQVSAHDEYKFDINVCGPVIGSLCGNDTGSCQSEIRGEMQHWSAGKANSHLYYHNGILYLNYTHGDNCGGGAQRSTVINFICGAEGGTGGPTFITETNCSYEFNWHTEQACERRVHCATRGSHVIDLTPLIKSHDNYKITTESFPTKEYFINVCRPVNSVPGLSCAAGSAACFGNGFNDGKLKNILSLGHPLASPVWISSNKTVELMYFHGSPCPSQPDISITTRIIFYCKEGVYPGEPLLDNYTHDCQYIFTWATDIVCQKSRSQEPVDKEKNCTFFHERLKSYINLSSLQRKTAYEVRQDNNTFTVNICGGKNKCKGGTICRKLGKAWTSYGNVKKVFYDYTLNALKMLITEGGDCQAGGTNKGEVWFQCDVNAGEGKPELYGIYPCYVVLLWRTNLVCESFSGSSANKSQQTDTSMTNRQDRKRDGKKSKYDITATGPNTVGIIVGIMTAASILCILFLIMKNPDQCRKLWSKFKISLGFRHTTKVKYSSVSTEDPEVTSSLLGSGTDMLQAFSRESDDDDLLGI